MPPKSSLRIDSSAEVILLVADAACARAGIASKDVSYVHLAATALTRSPRIRDIVEKASSRERLNKLTTRLLEDAELKQQRKFIETHRPTSRKARKPGSTEVTAAFSRAYKNTTGKLRTITDIGLFEACIEQDPIIREALAKHRLNLEELRKARARTRPRRSAARQEIQALNKHGTCLNDAAANGDFDTIVGRDRELALVMQVLCKDRKSNPVLVGAPGVGKTAIVEKLVQMIVDKHPAIPERLKDCKVYSLNMGNTVAATQYRGQFEDRMKGIVEEATNNPNIILFIDEMHTIVGAGGAQGSVDAAAMLKPAMAKGLRVIGATTPGEYKKYVEKDRALARRVEKIVVEQPSKELLADIMSEVQSTLSAAHGVLISDEAIPACIEMGTRYYRDMHEPDRAISLLDKACARVIASAPRETEAAGQIRSEISALVSQFKEKVAARAFAEAAQIKTRIRRAETRLDKELAKGNDDLIKEVTRLDVAASVSDFKNVPMESVRSDEAERILGLEEEIKKWVVGQEAAIDILGDAVRRSRVGIRDIRKPIGVFLFLGPTGSGKTHTCRQLARVLFDDEDALIKIDMSEYSERHSTSNLTGPPPGYIGYDDHNDLVSKVRERPYGVILLDEFEKASMAVHNVLLQVFDEGTLTDTRGNVADFRNYIIVMTSNIGGKFIAGKQRISLVGDQSDEEKLKELGMDLKAEVKKQFTPEFINRIDETVVFRSLRKEEMVPITKLIIQTTNEHAKYELLITDEAAKELVERGYSRPLGARSIKRAVTKHVESPLATFILKERVEEGSTILIDYSQDSGEFTFVNTDKAVKPSRAKKEKVECQVEASS